MTKLYIAPTIGRSADLPAALRQFLQSEPCTYRCSCTKDQLAGLNPDVPQDIIDSFPSGTEVVREIIQGIYGDSEEIVSWDAEGERYFIEIHRFEEDIKDLMMATGLRLTLDQTDRNSPHGREWSEILFGFPEIDEDAETGELETALSPQQEKEIESWES